MLPVLGKERITSSVPKMYNIFYLVLPYPFFSRLALVRGVGVCLDEVRVDVEGHELEGFERRRVNDGHVVGRVDRES